jgi:hypothetical protein
VAKKKSFVTLTPGVLEIQDLDLLSLSRGRKPNKTMVGNLEPVFL